MKFLGILQQLQKITKVLEIVIKIARETRSMPENDGIRENFVMDRLKSALVSFTRRDGRAPGLRFPLRERRVRRRLRRRGDRIHRPAGRGAQR